MTSGGKKDVSIDHPTVRVRNGPTWLQCPSAHFYTEGAFHSHTPTHRLHAPTAPPPYDKQKEEGVGGGGRAITELRTSSSPHVAKTHM